MVIITRGSKESLAIEWMYFPLAALVVLIHTPYTNDQFDFSYYLGTFLSVNLAQIAVPAFFFLSGYLFFAKYERFGYTEYVSMLKKKTLTLLLPYLIWNFIGYYVYGLTNNFSSDIRPWELYRIFWNASDGYVATSIFGYKFSILSAPGGCGVLWFVRDLIVAMLLSPIIWLIARRFKIWALIIFLLPWILKIGIPIDGFGLAALCFFPLGATFSILGKNIFIYLSTWGKTISVSFIIMFFVCYYLCLNGNVPQLLNKFLILLGIMFMCVLAYRGGSNDSKCSRRIRHLGECSFFIYVFHTLFVFYPMRFFIDPLTTLPFIGNTLAYLTAFLLKIGICVGVYYAMKKMTPSLLGYMVGGRIK